MKASRAFLLLLVFSIYSCTSDEPVFSGTSCDESVLTSASRSPEEVMTYIQGFVDTLDGITKSRGGSRRTVSDISAVTTEMIMTRATTPFNYNLHRFDTLLYIINFSDSAGFAIAGATLESEPVYAIIDNGNLNWDDLDDPITRKKHFQVCNFMNMAIVGPYGGGDGGETTEKDSIIGVIKNWDIVDAKSPILKSKWGQGMPFSKYCPNGTTGCVSTALAQLMSHYKKPETIPSQVYSGNVVVLNWNVIEDINEYYKGIIYETMSENYHIDAVAQLCRYIGRENDAEYHSNPDEGTSINSDRALNWARQKCNLPNSGLKKYDEQKIYESIRDGKPVYGRGCRGKTTYVWIFTKYSKGHAWVYDGYIRGYDNNSTDETKRKLLFHCNWGWNGTDNGFFLSKVFNTNLCEISESEYYAEFGDCANSRQGDDGTPGNYRYNLEYAVFY